MMPELKTYEQILKEFEILFKSYLDSITPKSISEEYLDQFVNYNNPINFLDIGIKIESFMPTESADIEELDILEGQILVNPTDYQSYMDIISDTVIKVDPFLPTDTKEMCAMKVNKAIQADCSHYWKTYTGFTEKYDYCEKCDQKRS